MPRPVWAKMTAKLTHRTVLAIALPAVLSNATVPILGAVDTAVVGQLGSPVPIGAVGIGAVFLTTFYWLFGFLRMGTVGLTAKAVGANDSSETVAMMMRSLVIAGAAGALIILAQKGIFIAAFWLSPASKEIEELARSYMEIRIWSAPAAIALFGINGWLIAQARTQSVMVIQISMNLLNIGLDFLFVMGFGWGVEGVAWGSFIAEWSGFLLALWLCRSVFSGRYWRDKKQIFQFGKLREFMRINGDIFLRSLLLQAIFFSFILRGANYGDVILASNQILLQFVYITAYALDGFAFGTEALVGQAIGARNHFDLRRAIRLGLLWSAASGIGFGIVFVLMGGAIIDVMTNVAEIRLEARTYLPWMLLAPFLGWIAWILDGIFIGATETRAMRNMMFASFLIYLLCLMILEPLFANHGLWIALGLSFVVRAGALGTKYHLIERQLQK